MAIEFKAIHEEGYIRIVTKGVLQTLEELVEYGSFMYEQATSSGVPRILLDEDLMEDASDAGTIYVYSEHEIITKTATAGIRIAGVCTPENYDINKVFETMFQNRSYNFRVFLHEQEAIDWLMASVPSGCNDGSQFLYCMEKHEEYLQFTVRGGPDSLQEMASYVNFMVEQAIETGSDNVLIDETDATIRLDFHKAVAHFELPHQEKMAERNIRVAVICPPNRIRMYEFFAKSLQSYPFELRVFDSLGGGLEWLED